MPFKTPWDNADQFEALTLSEVLERGISTSECNLWDGNEKWVSKTIDPYKNTASNGKIKCLYSGVCIKTYSLDQKVYLER